MPGTGFRATGPPVLFDGLKGLIGAICGAGPLPLPNEFERVLLAASGLLGGGIMPPAAPYGPGLIDRA